jgi:hypothetical protein
MNKVNSVGVSILVFAILIGSSIPTFAFGLAGSRTLHDVAVAQITSPEGINGTYYMRPGTIKITCIIQNLGDYDESDLICTATIGDVYSESVPGIDLGIADERAVVFPNATLDTEGTYTLTISLPLDNDSNQSNNVKTLIIDVDVTPPNVYAQWDPSSPNGNNGWYITPVTVTLFMNKPGTIYYKIDDGPWTVYLSPFAVRTVFYFYGIDYTNWSSEIQGISLRFDLELPVIVLSKQVFLNKLRLTATVNDTISGVDRVEFYLQDENGTNTLMVNDTDGSDGFQWTLHPIPKGPLTVLANVYDIAGNCGTTYWVKSLPQDFIQQFPSHHPFLQFIIRLFLYLLLH